MKYIACFLLLLMVISSCRSPLSEKKVDVLSVIDARIEILQDLTNKNINTISVLLYDKDGKAIRNKDIKLKVNGTDLTYVERQGLYYTTTSEYSGSDVPVDQVYDFRIILSDGKSYFLGSIRHLGEIKANDIICNERGDFNKDLVISWENLKDVNEVSVTKSVLLNTSTKTSQNYDSEPQTPRKIGSSGTYIIPKSNYISSRSKLSSIELKFSALKFGVMSPQLLKSSEIRIFGHIDKTIDFDEESGK